MNTKNILVRVAACALVVGAGTVGYASVFGEENLTLVQQLSELIGINRNTYDSLRETREGIDLAREAADDARRAQMLVADLQSYTTDRFIEDFKRDVLKTYPDLDYIIRATSAEGLREWQDSKMRSPMGSYELIGRVFGEVTEELREEQEEGLVQMEGAVLYRYEAAASLTAASDADMFIDKSDQDIEVLVAQLNGATREEAIVIQAKIQAVVAAQNSHMLRLMSRMVRREGVEDARHYQGSMQTLQVGSEMQKGRRNMAESVSKPPSFMHFDASWLE